MDIAYPLLAEVQHLYTDEYRQAEGLLAATSSERPAAAHRSGRAGAAQ